MPTIRIATRKSLLALWQAQYIADLLQSHHADIGIEIVELSTRGDEILDKSLQKIGGKSLFVKELEAAMLSNKADIAVHSMKDVPSVIVDELCIAAVTTRGDHRDALVMEHGNSLADLEPGMVIGTSSLRREIQLLQLRPDLICKPCRGNVNTRLEKLRHGDFDALVLAAAGLERLDKQDAISEYFSIDDMLPSPAQGAIGVECRRDDKELLTLLKPLNDPSTWQCVMAERAFNHGLGGSCQVPVAAYATCVDNELQLQGLLGSMQQKKLMKYNIKGEGVAYQQLGKALAKQFFDNGAKEILQEYAL